jgi:predicted anti-sigma-YlaC factor YlaD
MLADRLDYEIRARESSMDVRRLLPLSGVVFVVLALLGVVVLGGDTPESTAPGAEVLSFYDDEAGRQAIGTFVLAASVPFLVFFAVSLANAVAPADAGRRPGWDRVLVAGSGVAAALILVTAFVHFALADGGDNGVSPEAMQALNLLDGNTWVAFNAGLGVMMLGAAGSLLPRARNYRWLGWAALVLGVALFIPYADFIALILTLVWIIVTSVILFREHSEDGYTVLA